MHARAYICLLYTYIHTHTYMYVWLDYTTYHKNEQRDVVIPRDLGQLLTNGLNNQKICWKVLCSKSSNKLQDTTWSRSSNKWQDKILVKRWRNLRVHSCRKKHANLQCNYIYTHTIIESNKQFKSKHTVHKTYKTIQWRKRSSADNIHTYIQTYLPTYIQTCAHTCIFTYSQT